MRRLVTIAAIASAAGSLACSGDAVAGVGAEMRPDTPGTTELPPNFDPGDVVESFASPGGRVRVHFTRAGRHAVPARDTPANAVPDFVEEVATAYDAVLAAYEGLGFRTPVSDEDVPDGFNGGDARFDVYLVDFAGRSDGSYRRDACSRSPSVCAGYMVQENDYAGYGYPSTLIANRILASHELFHAVQAAYDGEQPAVMLEGTAVWATEAFDPSLRDFEALSHGYLDRTDRPLNNDLTGASDSFTYGAGVYFQFLTERYGANIVRELLDACVDGANGVADPHWYSALEALLARSYGTTATDAFTEFATWNLFTDVAARADISYDRGNMLPRVASTTVTTPFRDDRVRMFPTSARYYTVSAPTGIGLAVGITGEAAASIQIVGMSRSLRPSDPTRGDGSRIVSIDVSGARDATIAIVNPKSTGSSDIVGVCIGSRSDVEACLGASADAGVPLDDAGLTTPDGGADAGTPADATVDATPMAVPAGGGCAVSASILAKSSESNRPLTLLFLTVILFFCASRLARRRSPATFCA